MQERRYSGLEDTGKEGFGMGRFWDGKDSGLGVFKTGEIREKRNVGKRDTGKEGFMTGRIHEKKNTCRKGGIRDWRYSGLEGYRKRGKE